MAAEEIGTMLFGILFTVISKKEKAAKLGDSWACVGATMKWKPSVWEGFHDSAPAILTHK